MIKARTRLAYAGRIFRIEFYEKENGEAPVEKWLESLGVSAQQKFAALFVRLGDHGKIWNERKFKHLEGSNQIFEFKVDIHRILCFFFIGSRVILTHGFQKTGSKTPKGEIERAEIVKKIFEKRS